MNRCENQEVNIIATEKYAAITPGMVIRSVGATAASSEAFLETYFFV